MKAAMCAVMFSTSLLMGCATTDSKPNISDDQKYSGKGGMTAYDIKPEVYVYHYENGFTGIDAMGWDANLQYAWSRAGGALTCQIPFDKRKVISNLVGAYGYDDLVHDMNGVMFHNIQSQKVAGFCTPARVAKIQIVVKDLEQNKIPKRYK